MRDQVLPDQAIAGRASEGEEREPRALDRRHRKDDLATRWHRDRTTTGVDSGNLYPIGLQLDHVALRHDHQSLLDVVPCTFVFCHPRRLGQERHAAEFIPREQARPGAYLDGQRSLELHQVQEVLLADAHPELSPSRACSCAAVGTADIAATPGWSGRPAKGTASVTDPAATPSARILRSAFCSVPKM